MDYAIAKPLKGIIGASGVVCHDGILLIISDDIPE
jgi:hypothetical protein